MQNEAEGNDMRKGPCEYKIILMKLIVVVGSIKHGRRQVPP